MNKRILILVFVCVLMLNIIGYFGLSNCVSNICYCNSDKETSIIQALGIDPNTKTYTKKYVDIIKSISEPSTCYGTSLCSLGASSYANNCDYALLRPDSSVKGGYIAFDIKIPCFFSQKYYFYVDGSQYDSLNIKESLIDCARGITVNHPVYGLDTNCVYKVYSYEKNGNRYVYLVKYKCNSKPKPKPIPKPKPTLQCPDEFTIINLINMIKEFGCCGEEGAENITKYGTFNCSTATCGGSYNDLKLKLTASYDSLTDMLTIWPIIKNVSSGARLKSCSVVYINCQKTFGFDSCIQPTTCSSDIVKNYFQRELDDRKSQFGRMVKEPVNKRCTSWSNGRTCDKYEQLFPDIDSLTVKSVVKRGDDASVLEPKVGKRISFYDILEKAKEHGFFYGTDDDILKNNFKDYSSFELPGYDISVDYCIPGKCRFIISAMAKCDNGKIDLENLPLNKTILKLDTQGYYEVDYTLTISLTSEETQNSDNDGSGTTTTNPSLCSWFCENYGGYVTKMILSILPITYDGYTIKDILVNGDIDQNQFILVTDKGNIKCDPCNPCTPGTLSGVSIRGCPSSVTVGDGPVTLYGDYSADNVDSVSTDWTYSGPSSYNYQESGDQFTISNFDETGTVSVTFSVSGTDDCGDSSSGSDTCTFKVRGLEPKLKYNISPQNPTCGGTVNVTVWVYDDKYGLITPTRSNFPATVTILPSVYDDLGTCGIPGHNPCWFTINTNKLNNFYSSNVMVQLDPIDNPNAWEYTEFSKTITFNCSGAICISDATIGPVGDGIECGKPTTFQAVCGRNVNGMIYPEKVTSMKITGNITKTCNTNPCNFTDTIPKGSVKTYTVTCEFQDPSCPKISKTYQFGCAQAINPNTNVFISDVTCYDETGKQLKCVKTYKTDMLYKCNGSEYPILDSFSCVGLGNKTKIRCNFILINKDIFPKTVNITFGGVTQTVTVQPCYNSVNLEKKVNTSYGQIFTIPVSLVNANTGDYYQIVPLTTSREKTIKVHETKPRAVPEYSPITYVIAILIVALTVAILREKRDQE